mmetsp:Transcript_25521/g.29437  ORF Transcript_25521/g.29437 Transcript_25521/m.29437 type:complete len:334 (+) Transcript_25521:596-1597(+)
MSSMRKSVNIILKDIHPMVATYFHIRTLLAKWKGAKLFSGSTTTKNTSTSLEVVAAHAAAPPPQASEASEVVVAHAVAQPQQAAAALEVVAAHAATQPPQTSAALEVVATTAAALSTPLSMEEENSFQPLASIASEVVVALEQDTYEESDPSAAELLRMLNDQEIQEDADATLAPVTTAFTTPTKFPTQLSTEEEISLQPSIPTASEVITAPDGAIPTPLSTELQPITIVGDDVIAGGDAAIVAIPAPTSTEEKIAFKLFDIVRREKALNDFHTEHKLYMVMKTKKEKIVDKAKQILSCTSLTDIVHLKICGIRGHAIKTDTNKWTVYLEDQS